MDISFDFISPTHNDSSTISSSIRPSIPYFPHDFPAAIYPSHFTPFPPPPLFSVSRICSRSSHQFISFYFISTFSILGSVANHYTLGDADTTQVYKTLYFHTPRFTAIFIPMQNYPPFLERCSRKARKHCFRKSVMVESFA